MKQTAALEGIMDPAPGREFVKTMHEADQAEDR